MDEERENKGRDRIREVLTEVDEERENKGRDRIREVVTEVYEEEKTKEGILFYPFPHPPRYRPSLFYPFLCFLISLPPPSLFLNLPSIFGVLPYSCTSLVVKRCFNVLNAHNTNMHHSACSTSAATRFLFTVQYTVQYGQRIRD